MTRITEIALDGLDRRAAYLQTDAAQMEDYVRMLETKPAFKTRAEAALDDAEAALPAIGKAR
jgi:hypothetical protein